MKLKLDREQKQRIGELMRRQLEKNLIENARNGNSRLIDTPQRLAGAISVTDNTIYKAHSGEFSIRTLIRVEDALGVSFAGQIAIGGADAAPAAPPPLEQGAVSVRFGGYSKELIAPYLGKFLAFSRGVSVSRNFLGSVFTIFWDDALGGAKFKEDKRFTATDGRLHDYSQGGTLHMSAVIKTLHLLTAESGALRLITLTGIQHDPDPVMYGAVLTQVPEPGHYVPAKSTIHFRKILDGREEWANSLKRPITPDDEMYDAILHDLNRADEAIYTR